jgi:hypothetical protein
MNEWCDAGADVVQTAAPVGNRTVTYDGVAIKSLPGFAQNEYKSGGVHQQMVDDFIKEGYHPFDVFTSRDPEAALAPRHIGPPEVPGGQ